MTTQLSSLRVSADMNASNYVTGAKAVAGANAQIVSSGTAAGATVTVTQQKVASAGDVWTRLSRQYVEGASQAQKMQGALRTLQRGLDTGNISMKQAEQIIEGLNRKLGMMANAQELAANGQMQLAQAVTTVNARMKDSVPVHNTVGRVGGQNAFVMQNLAFQLNDVVSGFAMGQRPMQIFAQQGGQIYQALSMGEGGVGGSLKSIMALLVRMAPVLLPIIGVVGALSIGVAALGSKLSDGQAKALSFGGTIKGVFVTAWQAFTKQFEQMPGWFSDLWSKLGDITGEAVNQMIQQIAILGAQINLFLQVLPSAFQIGFQDAANFGIQAINDLTDGVNGAIRLMRRLRGETVAEPSAEDVAKSHVPSLTFAGDAQKDFAAKNAAYDQRVSAIMQTNYLGDVYKNGLDKDKKKGTKPKRDSFADLIQSAKGATAALQAQAAALGKTTQEAAYLEEKQKLLNRAAQAHIKLTPSQIAAIDSEAQAYGRAKAQLEAMTEVYGTLKDAFTGFFSDLKSNLQQGQTVWEAFGNAASNALNKIADKAIDMATSGIFDMLWGGGSSSGSGLGGIISGAISGMLGGGIGGSAAPFAIGGMPMYASGTDNAPGGLAVVGERGPELVNLARGSQVFSNERSRAMLAANGNLPTITFAPVYNINGIGLSAVQLQAVLAANNASLLKQLPAIQRDQYRRAA